MKVKLTDLVQFKAAYDNLKSNKMSIQAAFSLQKINKSSEENSIFFEGQLYGLLEEYAERDENNEFKKTNDGSGIKIQEDKLASFQEKYTELLNFEIEIPVSTIKLTDLKEIEISPEELSILMPFIEE